MSLKLSPEDLKQIAQLIQSESDKLHIHIYVIYCLIIVSALVLVVAYNRFKSYGAEIGKIQGKLDSIDKQTEYLKKTTAVIESIKSEYVELNKGLENNLAQKFSVYSEAIGIITRFSAASKWVGPDVPATRLTEGTVPNEFEINAVILKMRIYCNSDEVISAFLSVIKNGASPVDIGKFANVIGRDINPSYTDRDPMTYLYYYKG